MTILSREQVRNYEGIGASALTGLRRGTREALKAAEKTRGPIVGYVVREHFLGKRSIKNLADEIDIGQPCLSLLLKRNNIPVLTFEESMVRNKELKLGAAYGSTLEQRRERSSIGGRKTVEQHLGLFSAAFTPEKRRESGRRGGEAAAKLGVGVHGMTTAQRRENGKSLAKRGIGIHAASAAQRIKWARNGGLIGGRVTIEKNTGIHNESKRSGWAAIGGTVSGRITAEKGVGIHNPSKRNEYLHTRYGYRHDIDFDARSMWEANVARILIYLGFRIEPHYDFPIDKGTKQEKRLIMDFRAISTNGVPYYFEIVTGNDYGHFLRDDKVDIFEPYLDARLIRITRKKYKALVRAYLNGHLVDKESKLELETDEDNLVTNPKKWE
jgi:hypothetical protein